MGRWGDENGRGWKKWRWKREEKGRRGREVEERKVVEIRIRLVREEWSRNETTERKRDGASEIDRPMVSTERKG